MNVRLPARPFSTRQRGQALVFGIVLAMIAVATVVAMYNTGQVATEKTKVVDAADAAAYSGALYVARNLNFMAYTNRAMIANHVAVGHFVSAVSWVRYLENSTDKLEDIGDALFWVPYIGAWIERITDILAEIGATIEDVVEAFGEGYVPVVQTLNTGLSYAQIAAKAAMFNPGGLGDQVFPVAELMATVARVYDPRIRINDPQDLASVRGAPAAVKIARENSLLYQATERYTPSSDDGRMVRMVDASLGGSRQWIRGNRGWREGIEWFWYLEKTGTTRQVRNGDVLDWEASDELTEHWFDFTKWEWKQRTWAEGAATAGEFAWGDYEPVPGYQDLAPGRIGTSDPLEFEVTAYAVLPMEAARQFPLLGLESDVESIAASATARIYHRRPSEGFAPLAGTEYANLYNPFWEVSLTRGLSGFLAGVLGGP